MLKKISSCLLIAGMALPAVTFAAPVQAFEKDRGITAETDTWAKERFQFRVRAIGILADGDGRVNSTTLETDVGDAITPEFDVSYFFTDNIAVEAIAATAQHEVDAGASNIGNTWILPPTVTLQYHFSPEKTFSPYVGAGINYSLFYGEDDGAGFTDLEVDGGFGWALQAGADYWLSENWGLNVDVKYIDINVDAEVGLSGTPLTADDVELNPFVVGAGVSYRF